MDHVEVHPKYVSQMAVLMISFEYLDEIGIAVRDEVLARELP